MISCVEIELGVTQKGKSGFCKTDLKEHTSRLRFYFVSFEISQVVTEAFVYPHIIDKVMKQRLNMGVLRCTHNLLGRAQMMTFR